MLDMDKVLQQKQELDEKLAARGSSAKFWKPKAGTNRIRVMPGWSNEAPFAGQFWREVAQHWNVSEDQKAPILCPKYTKHMDGECPICDFVEELKSRKTDVAALELAKDLKAKAAFLLNILDLEDEEYTAQDVADWKKERPDKDVPFSVGDAKIQVYASPPTVFNGILTVITTNRMDITDTQKGHNIVVNKIPAKDRLRTKYEVTPEIKSTKAKISPETEFNALDKIGFVMSSQDMTKLLADGVAGDFIDTLPPPEEHESGAGGSDDLDDFAQDMRSNLED